MNNGARPLAFDLCCGLGGWTEGLLANGWDVVGFDIERHAYGAHRYPTQLVLQDILTLSGARLKDAALIVASPPCQEFSYMAMPWTRAKRIRRALRGEASFPEGYKGSQAISDLTALFDACFRIQREAQEAAGHFIPLVIENVRGAQEWVGGARWHYGSFYLWGDVPALMPITSRRMAHKIKSPHLWLRDPRRADGKFAPNYTKDDDGVKVRMGAGWYHPSDPRHVPGLGFNTHADRQTRAEGVKVGDVGWRRDNEIQSQTFVDAAASGVKVGGARGDDWFTHHNRPEFEERATKNDGGSWFNVAHNTTSGKGRNPVHALEKEGVKQGGDWLDDPASISRRSSSKSSARKAASAQIAKIPFRLSDWIAKMWKPRGGKLKHDSERI